MCHALITTPTLICKGKRGRVRHPYDACAPKMRRVRTGNVRRVKKPVGKPRFYLASDEPN